MAGNKSAFDAAMKRAQDYAFENAWDKALREYQRALDEFPDDANARTNQAQALFRLQQWPAALAAYQALLRLRPSDPFVLERIAECQGQLRQGAEAERTLMQIVAIYGAQNQVREALATLRKVLTVNPRNRQARERQADFYRGMGERNLAITEYLTLSRQALETQPEDLNAAVSYGEQAFGLDSNHPEAREWLYKLRRRQAEASGVQFDEKTLRVTEANQIEARELEQMYNLAVQYQEKGQYAAARVQFEAAQNAGLDTPALHYSLGLLYQQEQDWRQAIAHLTRAVDDPEYAMSGYYVLGECYRELNQAEDVVRAFENAVVRVDLQHVTKNEVNDLIDLYRAAAEANLAAGNVSRAATIFENLATFLQARRWRTGYTDQLTSRARSLTEQGLTGRLASIGGAPEPAPPPVSTSTTPLSMPLTGTGPLPEAPVPQAAVAGVKASRSTILRPITDFLREQRVAELESRMGITIPSPPVGGATPPAPATLTPASEEIAGITPALLAETPAVPVPDSPISALLPDAGMPLDKEASALIEAIDTLIAGQLFTAATDCCFDVIRLEPTYLPVHLRLAEIYRSTERLEDAVAKLQSVIDVYLVRGESEMAAAVFFALIALQPENINIRTKLITLLIDMGRPDAAAREYLNLAEIYHNNSQRDRALEELRRARVVAPQNAAVRTRTGLYLLKAGMTTEAVPEFSRALQIDPENAEALVGVLVCMAAEGNDTAWDVLETLLHVAEPPATRPEITEQLRSFALTTNQGELFYALALINDLDFPQDGMDEATRAANEKQQIEAQIEALDHGLRLVPARDRTALALLMRYRRAHLALATNDAQRGVTLLSEALSMLDDGEITSPRPNLDFLKLPTRLDIYQPLAQAYAMNGDTGRAIQALQAAKVYAPYHRGIYTRLAELYFRQGQLGAALVALDDLISHYQDAGQIDKVLEILGFMARLAPNNITVRQKLADAYLKIGYIDQGLAELEALGDLQHKAGLIKDAAHTYQRGADIYWQMGKFSEAFTVYQRILRMTPGNVEARQQLVHLYIVGGRMDEARREQKKIAEIYLQQKRYKEAIPALHEAIALAPDDAESYHALAQVLTEQNEFGQAARLYGRLRRMEPAKDAELAGLQAEMQRRAEENLAGEHPQPAGGR